MNQKTKKILFFIGLGIDIAATIFLFVVAIIMIVTMPKTQFDMNTAIEDNGPFIGYLQQHSTLYFFTCVLPLILLLGVNIVFLILYVRKQSKKEEKSVDDLSEEQKAALRAELLKELQGEQPAEQKAEESEAPKEEK